MQISHVALTSLFAVLSLAHPTSKVTRQASVNPNIPAAPLIPSNSQFNKRQYTINVPTIPTIPKVPDVPAVPSPTPRSRAQDYQNTVTAEGSEETEEHTEVAAPAIPAIPAVPATPQVNKRQSTVNVPINPEVPTPTSQLEANDYQDSVELDNTIDSDVQRRQLVPIVSGVPGLLDPSNGGGHQ